MDLKVPIVITDELTDEVITSTGTLDLSSGEIHRIVYADYDLATQGLPAENDAYEFTSGVLSHEGKDVEFSVVVNKTTGQYSVSASELLEIKLRAAALFAGVSGEVLLANASAGKGAKAAPAAPTEPKRRPRKPGRMH